MDLEFKDLFHFGGAFFGGFLAIYMRVPSERRRHKWMIESMQKTVVNSNQLTDHAKWSHKGIRLIAEGMNIDLEEAPEVESIELSSPVPYELSVEEITKSSGRPSSGRRKK